MKTASTMEAATAVESRSAVKLSATVESAHRPARRNNRSANTGARVEHRTAVEAGASDEHRSTAVTVIPGAGADEDSADKPVRAVVAVRRARVRRIRVVAVRANGRRADIGRADSHSDRSDGDANSDLRLRGSRRDHQANRKHCRDAKNLCVSHLRLLLSFLKSLCFEAHVTHSVDRQTG